MSFSALFLAASIAIPEVVHHETPMPRWYVEQICEERVERDNLPCAVVTVNESVCFAYMDMDGQSEPVQCFPRDERIDE